MIKSAILYENLLLSNNAHSRAIRKKFFAFMKYFYLACCTWTQGQKADIAICYVQLVLERKQRAD